MATSKAHLNFITDQLSALAGSISSDGIKNMIEDGCELTKPKKRGEKWWRKYYVFYQVYFAFFLRLAEILQVSGL